MVELAGFEPASGQSVETLSTCLVPDWVFERGLVPGPTDRTLSSNSHPTAKASARPAYKGLIRGVLCSRLQGREVTR